MMTMDDLTVVGVDGIRRTFDEHYDTMMCVEQDPTGAHHAIHNQHARIEELEAKLAKAVEAIGPCVNMLDALVAESGRYVEYDAEDAFRMGEWFEPKELQDIERARATLAELKGGDA